MPLSRRHLLQRALMLAATTATASRSLPLWSQSATASASDRIADIIREYAGQGIHRTGTDVDNRSAEWMQERFAALGIEAKLDPLPMSRVEIEEGRLIAPTFTQEGVPLYDCEYTDGEGVSGVLVEIGSDPITEDSIGVVMVPPSTSSPQHTLLDQARRQGRYKALLVVSDLSYPPKGAALINAEDFLNPVGPPTLQIGHEHWQQIQALIQNQQTVTVIARAQRVETTAYNVSATIKGTQPGLPPLVVMTPRSGWWQCASERGGGIAAFLEIARLFSIAAPPRDVIFTANTGHELGHTGLDQFLHNNPTLIRDARAWVHLGANFAAKGSVIRVQYSDYENEELAGLVLDGLRLSPGIQTPIGTRPLGEARNVFDGGGHFVSLLGSNPLFHHPDDVWPGAVDLGQTVRWVQGFSELARQLAVV
jgi:hypothetical protein